MERALLVKKLLLLLLINYFLTFLLSFDWQKIDITDKSDQDCQMSYKSFQKHLDLTN